jgi:hypothetical protein
LVFTQLGPPKIPRLPRSPRQGRRDFSTPVACSTGKAFPAFAEIVRQIARFIITIVGSGPERSKLEEEVKQMICLAA